MKIGLAAVAIFSALTTPVTPAAASDLTVPRRIVAPTCHCGPYRHGYRYARRRHRWAFRHFHVSYTPYWLLTPPWATSFAAVPDEQ